ncbi:MAG TPA: 16S rRNA (guanine(966)-N(2))-methyltransferase RsmD [Candidatus Limnocylindrales bacterium]|nr:16S rRNA (guanine(966)-N(2))-methyltransferase RsmD [Candidatus Limnocylindrales bacterium]
MTETGTAGRVIAGTARGTRLIAPVSGVRPLGDRVKQTLFAILEPELKEAAFLDLFAGSGAAGIEALSRGSERATFVERNAGAIEAIERNLSATHLGGSGAEVVREEAIAWLKRSGATAGPFGVIVADPPYDEPALLVDALTTISAAGPDGILAAGGVVVSKHFWRNGPAASIGLLASVRERRFGETGLTFHRWEAG